MDELDRRIMNEMQHGIPICEHPFFAMAKNLGVTEDTLIGRLRRLREEGFMTRFGPLFNAERLGGGLTLAALSVPPERYDEVAGIVNSFVEVAHNYAREHELNMWFVLATETPERVGEVIAEIESLTGCRVYDFPKQEEFYVGLHFSL
ncbi:MAG: AsnC family transcriptional regulator [Gammaproteobacteria bacterium]|nr:AsnC family transcriptional regulator [Gammaproteobacteria bacterium]